MIVPVKRMFLVIVLAGLFSPALAQQRGFILEQGFGRSEIAHATTHMVNPNDEVLSGFFSLGVSAFYRPERALVRFTGGIAYQSLQRDPLEMQLLRLPLGIEIVMGRKFQLLPGAGLYGSVLLRQQGIEPAFAKTLRNLHAGWYASLGAGYNFNEEFMLSISLRNGMGLTPSYSIDRVSPAGAPYVVEARQTDGFLLFGIRYTMPLVHKNAEIQD